MDASTGSSNVADRRLAALFPDEHPRARRSRLWLAAVAVLVVAVVVALLATDAFGSDAPGYRTAVVARHTVETTVHGVASIEPVSQAAVAFPVSGTVATVAVAPGPSVTLGQTLATLDAQELQTSLHTKQAALAQAQLNLADALAGNASGPASSGGGNGSARSASTTAAVSGPPTIELTAARVGAPGSVAEAQQAVVAAQQQVDAALAAASAAQVAAQAPCAAAGVTPPSSPSTTTSTTSTTTTTTPSGSDLAACQAALADLLTAQQAVSAAQHQLTAAEHALDALLAQQGSASGSGSGSGGGSSGFGGGGSGSRTTTSSGPSAADLASYQQAVDSASAAVAVAEQALQQGTIVSPIVGTVSALNLTVGESVSAASTSENVIVTGAGGFEVSTNLTVTEVPNVSPGNAAVVNPDGGHRSYPGKVVSISALPSSTTTASTNYLVVVGLDDPGAPLNNGDLGTVTIVTKRVVDVLAVPTSAVTALGGRHLVQLMHAGSDPKTVSVRVGATGADWTQVTSGVAAGDRVVIADLSAALPGSATSSTNGSTDSATSRIQGLLRGSGFGGGGGAGGFRGFGGGGGGGTGGFGGGGFGGGGRGG